MALPLIKKTVAVEPLARWQKVLLAVAFVGVVVAAGASVGLGQLLGALGERVAAKNEELARLDQEALATAKRLSALKTDLGALKALLERHVNPLTFLGFLEAVTHPDVSWRGMEANFGEPRHLKLRGVGRTFQSVAEQLERFRTSPDVSNLRIEQATLEGGGRISFSVEFVPAFRLWRAAP